MKQLPWPFLIAILTCTSSQNFAAQVADVSDTIASKAFPIPQGVKNQLFYIQRTPNTNTIIYQLNVDEQGTLDERQPIHPFWIRYQEDSSFQELSYIQRNYAYGLKFNRTGKDKYEIRFVSYKKYIIYLMRDEKDGQFKAYTDMDGKLGILNKIYLHIEGGTFWFPKVVYVEVSGLDPITKVERKVRFKP